MLLFKELMMAEDRPTVVFLLASVIVWCIDSPILDVLACVNVL